MFTDKPRELPQKVALILVDEFTMMPVSSVIEPLRLANRHVENELYKWSVHSVDGEPVAASNGIVSLAQGDLDAIDIFIVGVTIIETGSKGRAGRTLRRVKRLVTHCLGHRDIRFGNGDIDLAIRYLRREVG